MTSSTRPPGAPYRVAYLSLQAVVEGQDSWAAVCEVIRGMRQAGSTVDEWFVHYPPNTVPSPRARIAEMFRVQRRLARRMGEYDALYVRGHVLARYATESARRHGVAVIVECNGSNEDIYLAWPAARYARPLLEALARSDYRNADAVIAVTPQLVEWVKAYSGRTFADVSPNGANTGTFSPTAPRRPGLPPRYAVFFGQFAAWQGIRVIIDALETPEWPSGLSLVFVGDGALRPDVEEIAAKDDRVVYLGKLPYEEVAGVVAGAVASLAPAYQPARATTGLSPLKVYESMACGVPVIVSDTAALGELITSERCGLVVGAGDAAGLARALARIIDDPEGASEMGRLGREAAVQRHSWAARAKERLAVVEREIAARAGQPTR
jgi:glycosyltransferase involved in cell wall biosynthesis